MFQKYLILKDLLLINFVEYIHILFIILQPIIALNYLHGTPSTLAMLLRLKLIQVLIKTQLILTILEPFF